MSRTPPSQADTPPEPFGARLRRLRTAALLSQEELAQRAGLARTGWQTVSGLERGVRQPTLPTLLALTRGLGLDTLASWDGVTATGAADTANPKKSLDRG